MHKVPIEQIDILINLQQVESEGSRSKEILKGIEGKVKALDKQLREAQTAMALETEDLNERKRTYRDAESDIQDNQALIERNRERMRSVKTNKEYQALLKGIDELRERNSEIEDRMIEQLEVIEHKEAHLEELKHKYETLAVTIEAEKASILKEEQESRRVLSDLEVRVQEIAKGIDPSVMGLYKRVSARNNSMAIIPVRDAVCTGCNVNIPPQMYNELKQNQGIEICPHCQRMIYCER